MAKEDENGSSDQKKGGFRGVPKDSGVAFDPFLVTPENVAMAVTAICSAAGIATATIKGIGLWVDERKSRMIRVKYKDVEIEISGAQKEEEIAQKLDAFRTFRESLRTEDIEIVVVDDQNS